MMSAHRTPRPADFKLSASLPLWGPIEPAQAPPIEHIGELPLLLEPLNDIWSRFTPLVVHESGQAKILDEILTSRAAALKEALSLAPTRRTVQRARLDALLAFAETRYRKAEGLLWQVLASSPGEFSARAFLAEALIAQRLWVDAQDVLLGLLACRGEHASLAYARALRRGFESGLYQRLGSFP